MAELKYDQKVNVTLTLEYKQRLDALLQNTRLTSAQLASEMVEQGIRNAEANQPQANQDIPNVRAA